MEPSGVERTDTTAPPVADVPALLLLLLHAASRAAAAATAPTITSHLRARNMETSEMQLLPVNTRPARPRFTLHEHREHHASCKYPSPLEQPDVKAQPDGARSK
jgi:hypothetical protein